MLNNLTNFFNLIRSKRIKQALEPGDLIAVGTQVSRRVGEYKPTAIQYKDLLDQLSTELDSSVNYANNAFVDVFNGNDSTGLINDFTKPFATPNGAIAALESVGAFDYYNRGLVYIRRGLYNTPTNNKINLKNWINVYCEPGVVFDINPVITDNNTPVVSNLYGYLEIYSTQSGLIPLNFSGLGSRITIELKSVYSNAAFAGISNNDNLSAPTTITINAESLVSPQTLGQGFGMTLRGNIDVTLNVLEKIEANHSVVDIRVLTGKIVINCPNINLLSGNLYGGNRKHILYIENAGATRGKVIINANLNDLDDTFYGGISSIVRFWGAVNTDLSINGNIYAKTNHAVVLSNTDGTFRFSGIITSEKSALIAASSTTSYIVNSQIVTREDFDVIQLLGNAELHLENTTINAQLTTKSIVNMTTDTSAFYANNLLAQDGNGTGEYFLKLNTLVPTTGLLNVVSNLDNEISFVNDYAVAGSFTVEPNINTSKLF